MTANVLKVGTTGDYRPFTMLDRTTGEYSGLDIDLARPWRQGRLRAHDMAEPRTGPCGGFIAIGGISVTLDRQKTGFFSASYQREGKAAIARCADQARYQSLADIDRPHETR